MGPASGSKEKASEAPTTMEQADDEAIVSAVNEAAKEVADEAAASLDIPAPADTTTTEAPKPKKKETKKRIRRVGKTSPRKVVKAEKNATASSSGPTDQAVSDPSTATSGEATSAAAAASLGKNSVARVLSKHDEKWNAMFDKLAAYKSEHNSTLVPQCYDQEPRLGRWVHYQRVEYWIYQQSGNGKITPDRIARLESIGFEWDPQRAQWNQMFDKLKQYKEETGDCKVPKGYTKDPELANWVRNQRLEHANLAKGKKSRMTTDRYQLLNDLEFKWSSTMIAKPKTAATSQSKEGAAKKGGKATTTGKSAEEAPKDENNTSAAAAATPAAAVVEI